ncbi:MAG: NUDIX hydrolase [Candidatus Nanosyncoccaceae bacterium]|jgi:8-oxo-dGTP pyrophosphatase MutT (NUDIX family)
MKKSKKTRNPNQKPKKETVNPSKGRKRTSKGRSDRVKGRKPSIQEIVREPTAGGIIYRLRNGEVEILLIQDARDRWTIPKGHIEPGETAKQTAVREIGEEAGLTDIEVQGWLGKINFRYRRMNKLVLMTTQVYLVKALGDTDEIQKEEWMNDINWFKFVDAIDKIEYEDISKLMLLAMRRIRSGGKR